MTWIGKTAVFTVGLTIPASEDITVTVATVDDTATAPADYTAQQKQITIPAGQFFSTTTFSVPTVSDALFEAGRNEQCFVKVLSVDAGHVGNANIPGVAQIQDRDGAPVVTITGDSAVTEGLNAAFLVQLSHASAHDVPDGDYG